MRPLLLALITAVLLGTGGTLHAQKPDGKDGGAPPTKLKRYPDNDPLKRDGSEVIVWVAYEGYQPLVRPTNKGKDDKDLDEKDWPRVKLDKPIGFMQRFYVSDVAGQDYYLLATSVKEGEVKETVGWVPARYLVTKNSALVSGTTDIVRKVLIVNKQGELPEKLDEVKVRYVPSDKGEGKDEAQRLYTPLFVFGEADGYVLVGDAGSFSTDARVKVTEVVLGWLPRKRVEPWDTREALEWESESTLEPADRLDRLVADKLPMDFPRKKPLARRATPGKIYASVEDAEKGLKGEKASVLFQETDFAPFGKFKYPVSEPLEKDVPRFPMLRLVKRRPRAGDLYEVGGIGGLVDKDGKVLLTGKQLGVWSKIVDSLREQSNQTYILFAIDDTLSMDKFYPAVAGMVRRITDLAKENAKKSVHVGVVFYGDTEDPHKDKDKKPRPGPTELVPFREVTKKDDEKKDDARTAGEQIAEMIEKHPANGGGDSHEMVYRGILEGLAKSRPAPKAKKILIVIGDAGDISASAKRQKTDAAYLKKYTPEAIVNELVPDSLEEQTAWELYPIRVPDSTGGLSDACKDYLKQMSSSVELYQKRHREKFKEYLKDRYDEKSHEVPAEVFDAQGAAEGVAAAGSKKIEQVLKARYAKLFQQIKQAEVDSSRLKKGQFGTKLTPEMEQRINDELKAQKLNVTLEQLRSQGGVQIFQKGYVWARTPDRLPQVRRLVMLDGRELLDLKTFLTGLELGKNQRTDAIAAIIERQAKANPALKKLTPAELNELSLEKLKKQALGLAFRHGILGATYEDLKTNRTEFTQQELLDLQFNSMLLDDVRNAESHRYTVSRLEVAGRPSFEYARVPGTKVEQDRGFHIGNDKRTKYYYLDFEKEWP